MRHCSGPRRFEWTPAGTGGNLGRDLLNLHREAARPPNRNLTRTLCGGEPVALTGRLGGTDEMLGRAGVTSFAVPALAKGTGA